ncbi:hypothetical protein [Massilia forsythiae]|uniref:hypothetical protein n=1 Tax=Massilia forsythiae TaxID=2728020 RepID=UPI001B7D17BB|nr:hypothetical protein [Massilia forsythiae]
MNLRARGSVIRIAALAGLLVAGAAGWLVDARALLACWLAAWWWCAGILMGGLANVWLHNLTGGAWGEAIRAPLLHAGRRVPLACLLLLPLLAGVELLYPWAAPGGTAHWRELLSAPDFKLWWLSRGFFTVRALGYLALWSLLSWLARRPALARSQGFAALALLAYGVSVSFAALDWIMSLQPEWRSSVFGWLAGSGQMLAGMALAIVLIDRERCRKALPDLGNLLLMYVLLWAYMAYVQYLIIWGADLPNEIAWYVRRRTPLWTAVAWTLAAFHFAAPLLILLSRRAKRAPRLLGLLALGLLAAHLLDCWWLVLPGAAPLSLHWLWMAPLLALGMGALLLPAPAPTLPHEKQTDEERAHA